MRVLFEKKVLTSSLLELEGLTHVYRSLLEEICYINLAIIYRILSNYEKALEYCRKSLEIRNKSMAIYGFSTQALMTVTGNKFMKVSEIKLNTNAISLSNTLHPSRVSN